MKEKSPKMIYNLLTVNIIAGEGSIVSPSNMLSNTGTCFSLAATCNNLITMASGQASNNGTHVL